MARTGRSAVGVVAWASLIIVMAAACDGNGDGQGPPLDRTAAPASSPAAGTLPAAAATSEPARNATIPAPLEGAYKLAPTLPSATFEGMLGFSTVPGAEGEAVVLTQGGGIWRVALDGSSPPTLFADLSERLIADPRFEEGLLGLAFSPTLQTDGRVYVYYTAGEPRRSILSRFQVVGGSMDTASEHVLLELPQPFSNHNGGQLAFGPDGFLYVALGDGGSAGDPSRNGQNLSTLLGSILRIDVSGEDYAVPPDNPFVERPGARSEIYAYGLRNPWRFSFDRATGNLWAGDVGQNRWEEVDLIVAGGNYGWNIMEGLECFEAAACDTGGLQTPRAVYSTGVLGCSVTGGFVYRGPSMPELTGWYIFGDFCSGRVWAVNTADDSPPVLLVNTGLPITSFGELPDGELLALTFANAVFRLERGP